MKRYFAVSYVATNKNGAQITGACNFEVFEGKHLSRKNAISWIINNNENEQVKNVVITFFTELSESDYNDWIS